MWPGSRVGDPTYLTNQTATSSLLPQQRPPCDTMTVLSFTGRDYLLAVLRCTLVLRTGPQIGLVFPWEHSPEAQPNPEVLGAGSIGKRASINGKKFLPKYKLGKRKLRSSRSAGRSRISSCVSRIYDVSELLNSIALFRTKTEHCLAPPVPVLQTLSQLRHMRKAFRTFAGQ